LISFSQKPYRNPLPPKISDTRRPRPGLALRDHPRMQYRGLRNWPPRWTQAGTEGNKVLSGEVGTLKQVNRDSRSARRCFLVIESDGERYVGALLFDDEIVCWLVSHVLRSHIGWSIRDLGDLDLSFTVSSV
jgi:hypothetical protein